MRPRLGTLTISALVAFASLIGATPAMAYEVGPSMQGALLNSADIPAYANDMGAGVMQTACSTYGKGYADPVSSRAAANTVVSGFSSDFVGNGDWQSTVGRYATSSTARTAFLDLRSRAHTLCTSTQNVNVGDDGDMVMATVSSRFVDLPSLHGLPRFAVAASTIIWNLDAAMNDHPTMGYEKVNGSSYTVFTVDGPLLASVEVSSTQPLDSGSRTLAQHLAPTVADRVLAAQWPAARN